jgi:hypothetical protein
MRKKLTVQFVESAKAPAKGQTDVWDTKLPGLGLRLSQGGRKSWTVIYRMSGRPRRHTLGPYPAIGLADARELGVAALRDVHHGKDPGEAKRAVRNGETFRDLALLYLERHAKRNKRSWQDDERVINRELLPTWANRKAADLKRVDVMTLDHIVERGSPVMANSSSTSESRRASSP